MSNKPKTIIVLIAFVIAGCTPLPANTPDNSRREVDPRPPCNRTGCAMNYHDIISY